MCLLQHFPQAFSCLTQQWQIYIWWSLINPERQYFINYINLQLLGFGNMYYIQYSELQNTSTVEQGFPTPGAVREAHLSSPHCISPIHSGQISETLPFPHSQQVRESHLGSTSIPSSTCCQVGDPCSRAHNNCLSSELFNS